jgi:DNA-binding MarR family transcriptional regulator
MHVEELSPSEFRVLRFLPTNLSRSQIASELSVSLNTASTHVCSIYANDSGVARGITRRLYIREKPLARRSPDPGDADSPARR